MGNDSFLQEVKSMVDQIKRCYSYNRTSEQIVHLALTSFTGTSKNEFHKRANGYELWKNFTIHEKGLEEVWPSEEVPGKEHLEKLKKLQIIASAKSEAVKAKALAAMATGAESTVEGEPVEAGSTSGSGLIVSAPESAPASDQTTATTETTTLATSASLPIATTDQPSASPTSLPSPSASEPVLSAADIKALEQERLLKEEKLATIPAVKKVVYLSADSPNTITKLDAGTCYILGGIVDKNRYPNLCQSKAEKLGIETAQLPIGDYIQMSSRRILTVNQVFEILLQFIECNDWKEAFLKVIPQRKLEDKPRQRRSVESWRPNHARDGKLTSSASGSIAGDSGSNSLAGSVVSDDESDHENDSQEGGAVDAA
ncbi:tRNA (guanine(9)-N(1))-methyltransferase [Mortierella claussenii]|nr:tRNA (guanine(9)-N(1))-methyltransferase [Mortierella claussenii]